MATKSTGRPELAVIADPTLDLLDGWVLDIMPNPDRVLRSLGGDLAQYAKLVRDDTVQSALQQRRDALIGREWVVEPGGTSAKDKAAADSLREMLQALEWDSITKKMLMGLLYGYSVAECIWAVDGKRVYLADIKVRRASRFAFGREGELRLLKRGGIESALMPERKFWVATFGADDDDTFYGQGLGYQLWWPVFLKRNGAKFWSIFLDKFGSPTPWVQYPGEGNDAQKRTAIEAALAFRHESAIATPAGFAVQLLEAGKGGQASYGEFLAYWDNAILKILLSQTGTTNSGPYVGTAEVHKSVRLDIIRSDGDILNCSFSTTVAAWLTEWNHPGAAVPRVWRVIEDADEEDTLMERDKKLSDMGLELRDDAAVAERYGAEWRKRPAGASSAPSTPSADFAEGGQADDAAALAGQLDALTGEPLDTMIARIREILDNATNLEDALAQLLDAYPGMELGDLAGLMGEAGAVSRLQGMLGVVDDA
ncbi:MAG: DUF935 domain-containing protein [Desulfovibrionaceae bacterium]